MKRLALVVIALALAAPGARAEGPTVVGAWTLNKDLTPTPPARDGERRPEGHRGGGGGGRGGFGGGGFGGFGGGNGPSEKQLHQMEVVRRRLTEIPAKLIITRQAESVTITDDAGRSAVLKTDGKKQERLTGDGEFTSKTHFEGERLIVEEDFGGPKVTTTFTPVVEGEATRLQVTLKVDGMPGRGGRGGPPGGGGQRPDDQESGGAGQPRPGMMRVYDLDAR